MPDERAHGHSTRSSAEPPTTTAEQTAPKGLKRRRWARAQKHERRFWDERGDVASLLEDRKSHYAPAFAALAERLPDEPVVADVGSGPTCWARFLRGSRIYLDPLMFSYSERWGDQLPAGLRVAAMAEALPLKSASCDLVFSVNAVDHSADPAAFIRECARVVKPGGVVAISVYAYPPLRVMVHRLHELFYVASDDPHPYSFARGALPRLIEQCGLKIEEVLDLGSVSAHTPVRWLQRTEEFVIARPHPTDGPQPDRNGD